MKRPVMLDNMENYEMKYFQYCTAYSFKHIKEQLQLAPKFGVFSNDGSGRLPLGHDLCDSDCVPDKQTSFHSRRNTKSETQMRV